MSNNMAFAATQNVFYTNNSVNSSGPSIFKLQSSSACENEVHEATVYTSRQRGMKETSLFATTEEEEFNESGMVGDKRFS